jgi:hypothetical protein
MDTIQYITPDFTITVTLTNVVAVITLDDGMDYESKDITHTSLGKLLSLHAAGLFGYADAPTLGLEEPIPVCGQPTGNGTVCQKPATMKHRKGTVCPEHFT